MAQKIKLELTIVEAQHLEASIEAAQSAHSKALGRTNPALTRVTKALDKAVALNGAEDLDPVDPPVDEK